jgi:hypothetical protein
VFPAAEPNRLHLDDRGHACVITLPQPQFTSHSPLWPKQLSSPVCADRTPPPAEIPTTPVCCDQIQPNSGQLCEILRAELTRVLELRAFLGQIPVSFFFGR